MRPCILTVALVLFDGACGGSMSSTPPNPLPSVTSVSPTLTTAGGSAFTLTVDGSNFVSASTVLWNGTARITGFVNTNQLTASISAADIATPGTPSVSVSSPPPGGGQSAPVTLTVSSLVPSLSSVSPTVVTTGHAFTLTVTGGDFVSGSTVQWNGNDRTTAFVSATQLTDSITAADAVSSGDAQVTVRNPMPGGGASTAIAITVVDILADASQPGPEMTAEQLGTNMQVTLADVTNAQFVSTFKSLGIGLVRWPGGILSDWYHWQTNTFGPCSPYQPYSGNAFDSFMQDTIASGGFNAAITVNYGTNATCTTGGDAAEAAAWVNYANNMKHYGIKYWTIGNEEYYTSSPDLNTPAHDAVTYANRVATLFYPQMKAADPTIMVGVDLLGAEGSTWDNTVLANAKYDFVEIHVYPEDGTDDNDTFLLTQGVSEVATTISTVQSALTKTGRSGTPIYLGEFDGTAEYPFGKQQVSIVDALFIGMAIGELTKAGVLAATVWDGIESCNSGGNFSASLYGWQTFATSGLLPATNQLVDACSSFGVPLLTPFPKARTVAVASQFVHAGEHVLLTQAGLATTALRAYAATQGQGFALMLFNLDQTNSVQQLIEIQNVATTSFVATTTTYGKAQYDQSQSNVWAGPVINSLGTVGNPFTITLPPWSMTVVQLGP